jgi:hypothetical protein
LIAQGGARDRKEYPFQTVVHVVRLQESSARAKVIAGHYVVKGIGPLVRLAHPTRFERAAHLDHFA